MRGYPHTDRPCPAAPSCGPCNGDEYAILDLETRVHALENDGQSAVGALQIAIADQLTPATNAANAAANAANALVAAFAVYIERLPGVVLGTSVSMAQAQLNVVQINAALATFGNLVARQSSVISCAGQIALTDGCSIVGEGLGPTFRMRADAFSNVDPINYTGSTGTLFMLNGGTAAAGTVNNVTLRNIRISSSTNLGRYVCAIYARNTANLIVENVEIFGIPNGKGIVASSLRGNWSISNNYIHDFYDNSATSISGAWTAIQQSTGIEIDDRRVDDTLAFSSSGGRISKNHIENIMKGDIQSALPVNAGVGAPSITAKQTTGIAVASSLSNGIEIDGNTVVNVAQGFDIWGFGCTGSGNRFRNSYFAALCLKHDARGNIFTASSFINSGACHILVSYGDTTGVKGNTVDGWFASGAGYNNSLGAGGKPDGVSNTWVATSTQRCSVYVYGTPSGFAPATDNQFLNGVIDSTIAAPSGIIFDNKTDNPYTSNSNNIADNIRFINGLPTDRRIGIANLNGFTGGKVRLAGDATFTLGTMA